MILKYLNARLLLLTSNLTVGEREVYQSWLGETDFSELPPFMVEIVDIHNAKDEFLNMRKKSDAFKDLQKGIKALIDL